MDISDDVDARHDYENDSCDTTESIDSLHDSNMNEQTDLGENKKIKPNLPVRQQTLNKLQRITCTSKSSIRNLIKKNGADNLPLHSKELKRLNWENNEEFYRGHQQSIPLRKADNKKEIGLKTLEIVASDIGPKMPAISRNGNKYPFLFIDKKTKYLMTYFGKTKSSFPLALKKFRTELDENHRSPSKLENSSNR